MNLAEKISFARKEKGLTQEQLASQLGVSRSAIAKWESGKGLPDIENIVVLSEVFGKSTDFFLKEKLEALSDAKEEETECTDSNITMSQKYIGKVCTVFMSGWNDGVNDVLILDEDSDFIFYRTLEKKKQCYGMVSKCNITGVEISGKQATDAGAQIDRTYFVGKCVNVELTKEKGLIKGFFDFRDDDYMGVVITSFRENEIELEFGRTIRVDEVSKIEEDE